MDSYLAQHEDYKNASCSYPEANGVDTAVEPMRCFTELSEAEQLAQLKSSVVSGKLKGELPFGFLARFRDLPNELIVKIW